MSKIAFVSNREDDNSLFSKKDDYRWKAISKAVEEIISRDEWRGHTFLIPIYTRFDRLILQLAERYGNPVEFYFPEEDWGQRFLPTNDIQRIERMRRYYPAYVVNGTMERLERMCADSDGVVILRSKANLGGIEKAVMNKRCMVVPIQEAIAQYQEMMTTV